MINDGASACITNNLKDFIGRFRHIDQQIKGITGHAQATHRGTVRWKIKDNAGKVHLININDTYYMVDVPNRILLPQHFSQAANNHHPKPEGMGSITSSKNITLFWGQQRYTKTIPLDKNLNISLTWTAPACETFTAYLATMPNDRVERIQALLSHVIPESADSDDDASMQPKDPVQVLDIDKEESPVDIRTTIQEDEGATTTFGMQDLAELYVKPNDEQPTTLSAQDKLISSHHRLGHLPYDRIQSMSQKGILPKRLLKCTKPFCAACQYGKLMRKPWLERGADDPIQKATSSSQIVSVDQLKSSMAGFIAQLKGKLTTQMYWYAAVFVDQYSQYAYVYLQQAITSAKTVQAKHSFEHLAEDMGVHVYHYHADNGRFADKGFIQGCQKQCQGLTYCGVNTHFQNGIAGKKIRDLQEQTRTMMLHALQKWSSMFSIHRWP